MIMNTVNKNIPCFIVGDFNMNVDIDPHFENFYDVNRSHFVSTNILGLHQTIRTDNFDQTPTYDSMNNKLAKLNSTKETIERFDRIYYQKAHTIYSTEYKVRTDIPHSDHYPIECVFTGSNTTFQQIQVADTTCNKKTSIMIIIHNSEIDRIRKKYNIRYDKWMNHLDIFIDFVHENEFDTAYFKIHDMIQNKYIGTEMNFDNLHVSDQAECKMLWLMPDDR